MVTVKEKFINTVLKSMDENGRPSTSDKAIELLVKCLRQENLIISNPTVAKYATAEEQIFDLISKDITTYGKASSNSIGAQRAYNLLSEAGLLRGE